MRFIFGFLLFACFCFTGCPKKESIKKTRYLQQVDSSEMDQEEINQVLESFQETLKETLDTDTP